jgi:2-oxoglutarate dehydrogenase E2 component (dihydrolipoamide succinyltransferase)
MNVEVKVPTPGESITEVEIGSWLVEDGAVVAKDQEIAEVESDKATLTVVAPEAGQVKITARAGDTVEVGAVMCMIDTGVEGVAKDSAEGGDEKDSSPDTPDAGLKNEPAVPPENVSDKSGSKPEQAGNEVQESDRVKVTPLARELMKKHEVSVDDVLNGLKRLGKKEVEAALDFRMDPSSPETGQKGDFSREEERKSISPLRRKLADRLVSVKNETAMLTTFNEVDMGNLMELRKKYQQQFIEKYGFKLGFMSFFTKAAATAMHFHPAVNARFDGDDMLMPRYVDVGIAVSTPKGLMVPVVRNAESKSVPQIEQEIKELAEKARNKKITVDELSGGTFTITNGGVFGSLLSTPVINPPQSAILGMHNIVDRPVAIDGQVVIRPMMYIALSYDHRMIDGKDSVGFLVKLKELIEHPERLFSGGREPEKLLLGL